MPNHFHFIVVPKAIGCKYVVLKERQTHMQYLSKAIGKTLSSYTQALNIEQNRTGNLFQKKTKAKDLSDCKGQYFNQAIHYVHFNPVAAGLVSCEADWEFSSYKDYCGLRNGTLCNKNLLYEMCGMSMKDFIQPDIPDQEMIDSLF